MWVGLPGVERNAATAWRQRVEWLLLAVVLAIVALLLARSYDRQWLLASRGELDALQQFSHLLHVTVFLVLSASLGGALFWVQRRRQRLSRLISVLRRERRDHDRHMAAVLEHVVDGIVCVDGDGVVLAFNSAASRLFGYAPAEILGRDVAMLMPLRYRRRYQSELRNGMQAGIGNVIGSRREVRGLCKGGREFPVMLAVSRLPDRAGPRFIGLLRDMSETRRAEARIRQLSYYDALTKLPNRNLLLDRLARTLHTAGEAGGCGALFSIDIDDFKSINDARGHGAGDLLLCEVAQRLRSCVRETDVVARLAGDTFGIMLAGLVADTREAAQQAHDLGGRILGRLNQIYRIEDEEVHCAFSMGVALFDVGGDSAEMLLAHADMAMHQAKQAGGGRLCFFDPAMQQLAVERAALLADLHQAIEADQLRLYYQLQVDGEGRATGFEALVRWQHPQRGMVPPGEFIGLAEESGLIVQMGRWVQETACARLAQWVSDPERCHLTMSVNVSVRQLRQADYVDNLLTMLARTGAPPGRLKLELTESMLVGDAGDIIRKMQQIQAYGIGIALDDFGTGYSSLAYLARLPLEQLKIDRSFVCNIEVDEVDAMIAQTIVSLGKILGLQIVAEGVETQAQWARLVSYGCTGFQGFLFGKPGPDCALPAPEGQASSPAAVCRIGVTGA
ncbi:putative bifunctional diguanylate cyclase/phosphodiesterase [Corticimicrobacter populi]|uniref:Diguanylate cyclase n=1 Tax=Corticimicrobacter populi TaxID=2175229 RepID=A0A2V1K3S1_9BURK|nr:EAL domain-containing protein [Corticimicrobacter populi]PWF23088.1 diguanylate cyclase [Corticimicrobacter populi]